MKCYVDMGSGAYEPGFIEIGSGIQQFVGGRGDTHTDTQTHQGDLISLFF
jgi:hypothetical protein